MNGEILDNIGRTLSEAAETVGRKTGEFVEITKLKNQVYSLEREITRDYADLGKMIYERYMSTGSIEEAFLPICEGIAQKEILIEEYNGEIECLRKEK